ncbi:MAG: hypothetical protein ACP5UQ_05260 [Anaerolineae bacterium]
MKVARQTTFILALLVSIFAWAALTYPGYFELEHGFRPVFNLTDLAHHLPAIGWAPTVGQPYDLLRGEGALPYWLALALRALTRSSAAAVRWSFALAVVAGATGMYAWTRRSLGEWPALIAAAVYALWPAGLATIYVRGAPAEATFLAAMPWLLWAADRMREPAAGTATTTAKTRWAGAALTLGLALLIWTQAGLSLWFAGVLVGAMAGKGGAAAGRGPAAAEDLTAETQRGPGFRCALHASAVIFRRLWPVVGGLALGALGLLPVALRYGLTGNTYVNFADHLVLPHLFLWPGWSAATGTIAPSPELSFQLGLMACALAALGLLLPRVARSTSDVARFALAIVLMLAFLSSTLAAPLWRLLPPIQGTLTYPWQLLLLAGPWLAWLAGAGGQALFDQLPAERRAAATPLLAACLLTLILLASYGYLRPAPAPAPIPDAPLAIFGENEIALLEATPTIIPPRGATGPAIQAGATISVTVRWQALRPLARDYTVFLHLMDPNGQLQGQQDTMPHDNKLPTTLWRPGQIIADQYHATLKPGAPAGEGYRVYLGLYRWQTGERLRTGTDDKVIIKP